MRFWDCFVFLTEQISILRSWTDDVVAVTRLCIKAYEQLGQRNGVSEL